MLVLTASVLCSVVSCSVPVFYGSSQLYAKDKNGNIVPWNPGGGT